MNKHLSMELTTEGARVTNLKLEGGRMVLTIEAQVVDSHIISAEVAPESGAPEFKAPEFKAPESGASEIPASKPRPVVPVPVPIEEPGFAFGGAPIEPAIDAVETIESVEPFEENVIALTNDSLSFSPPPFAMQEPMPEPVPAPAHKAPPEPLSEESSILGGERHGEPRPTISFGQELPRGIAFQTPPAPILPPIPEPAPTPMPLPDFGFSPAPEAAQPEPAFAPPPAPIPAPAPEKRPEQQPEKQPEKQPEPAETGGTTVLIRYTCPKCKTQGMQAVDKVGTVVNCSNCGKAMRLVMKK